MQSANQVLSRIDLDEIVRISIQIDGHGLASDPASSDSNAELSAGDDACRQGRYPSVHLFRHVASMTVAERFPRLTCFAVFLGLLATAIVTEIECLKGSGYFWQ